MYGVPYGEVDIRFVVEGDTLTVVEVVPYTERSRKVNTNRWMQEVNARFPVRKSKVQKAQFRQYVLQKAQEMGYAARMEENKAICTNRNIVVGDVDKEKVLVTAHYDTPATVGLPNVMLPMNRPMFYLVQALIALVMVVFISYRRGL